MQAQSITWFSGKQSTSTCKETRLFATEHCSRGTFPWFPRVYANFFSQLLVHIAIFFLGRIHPHCILYNIFYVAFVLHFGVLYDLSCVSSQSMQSLSFCGCPCVCSSFTYLSSEMSVAAIACTGRWKFCVLALKFTISTGSISSGVPQDCRFSGCLTLMNCHLSSD